MQGVALDPAVIDGLEFAGKAVLLWTGWGAKWGRPEYQQYPFIGAAMVAKLMEGDAKFVGVDFLVRVGLGALSRFSVLWHHWWRVRVCVCVARRWTTQKTRRDRHITTCCGMTS